MSKETLRSKWSKVNLSTEVNPAETFEVEQGGGGFEEVAGWTRAASGGCSGAGLWFRGSWAFRDVSLLVLFSVL